MLEFQRRAETRGTLKLRAGETQPLVAEAKKNESENYYQDYRAEPYLYQGQATYHSIRNE